MVFYKWNKLHQEKNNLLVKISKEMYNQKKNRSLIFYAVHKEKRRNNNISCYPNVS